MNLCIMIKMKISKIFYIVTLATLVLSVVHPVQARVENDRAESVRKAVKENVEERRDARKAEACENIEERIAQKIAHFDSTHRLHVRQYELMKEKIGKVILEKGAEGKNVDSLREHLAVLNTKIEKFNTDRTAFIAALKNVRQHECGESDGAFKEAVEAAQEKQKIVVADTKDIRSYYTTVIRADLKALRD